MIFAVRLRVEQLPCSLTQDFAVVEVHYYGSVLVTASISSQDMAW